MGTISLEGMEFFAYHGFYDEEQKIGSKFSIDITIATDLSEAAEKDRLKATVNYEILYKIIADVMQERHRLLEHVGYKIIHSVRSQFPHIQGVTVSVSKFNPPVGGVCTRAKVVIEG
jgi:7,8-dihydroneopterin aldolase/epimerase/oxygenase